MSSPSTPRPFEGGSSRSPTRAAPASPNPEELLTPRRKYQQLLAQFDDSDDDVPVKRTGPAPETSSRVSETTNKPIVQDAIEANSDSDEPAQRPQGRTAGRMMGRTEHNPGITNSPGVHTERAVAVLSPSPLLDSDSMPTSKPARRLKQRSASPASGASRRSSPGLFMSPAKPIEHNSASGSESESEDFFEIKNTKFKELLAKKRAENKAARKATKKKEAPKAKEFAPSSTLDDFLSSDSDRDAPDDEDGQRLTQQAKPTRKASKKAMEEINRETQRLARNQYLAHQATVKRKVTKQDLFRRFNFRQEQTDQTEEVARENNSEDEFVMSGALISSDAEINGGNETPASSPPSVKSSQINQTPKQTSDKLISAVETSTPSSKLDKDNTSIKLQAATASEVQVASAIVNGDAKEPAPKKKSAKRVRVVLPKITRIAADHDPEDDLVIEKPTAFDILNNAPTNKARESNSLLTLKHLANLTSPGKKRPKGNENMTSSELFAQLRANARKQAVKEKEERLNELRAKGIHIETTEEREKAQLEMENLLERAREDAQLLAKKEKAAAKLEGKELDGDHFDDDSDDEEFVDEEEDGPEDGDEEIDLSEDEDEDDDGDVEPNNPLFDQEAEDDGSENDDELPDLQALIRPQPKATPSPAREASPQFKKPAVQPRNRKVILDDDEDETEDKPESNEPPSTADALIAAFGIQPVEDDLSLSQIFAGTIGNQPPPNHNQESMDFFMNIPGAMSQFNDEEANPKSFPQTQEEDTLDRVTQTPEVHLGLSQFQTAPMDVSPSAFSDIPEPTQDVGYTKRTPFKSAGVTGPPPSTIETVLMPTHETPVPKRRRHLKRKTSLVAVLSDDEESELPNVGFQDDEEFLVTKDAFSALFKGAKKRADAETFDKKKSAAKELVEEQAEESEDEYAGLGGLSDDESAGELDEETRRMIDEGPVHVDEQQLAAFHADKERQADEKQIDKLYKDVTTGMLRRKRGGDFEELDDSDDDHVERRRRKQEDFARMRRALLTDENVNKLAQNPKQEAFFHAIEDKEDFGQMNFLNQFEDEEILGTQDEDEDKENQPEGFETKNGFIKRKLPDEFVTSDKDKAPPAKKASAPTNRKTFNPVELRKSLSFICDETVVPATQIYSSDHEDEEEDDLVITGSFTVTRTNTSESLQSMASSKSASIPIVNRLLRRRTSLESNEITQAMAFAAPGAANTSFKAPSLLRRATGLSTGSASSTSSKSSKDTGVTTAEGSRFGGSKKSNMHYQAKEAERRKVVGAVEEKKRAQLKSLASKGRTILGGWKGAASGFE